MRVGPVGRLAVVVAIVVAGCAAPGPSPSVAPSAPSPSVTASPAPSSGTPASPAPGAISVDPALLDVLPPTVAGLDRVSDEATAAELAGRSGLAASLEAIAIGLYAGPGPTPAQEDLAIVSIARLLEGVAGDAWFRDWRDTYDAAACEPAGGLAGGSAQADIDGRTVYIGTCQNGVHTYHVLLADPDRVVSITALGDDRIGEQVVGALTE